MQEARFRGESRDGDSGRGPHSLSDQPRRVDLVLWRNDELAEQATVPLAFFPHVSPCDISEKAFHRRTNTGIFSYRAPERTAIAAYCYVRFGFFFGCACPDTVQKLQGRIETGLETVRRISLDLLSEGRANLAHELFDLMSFQVAREGVDHFLQKRLIGARIAIFSSGNRAKFRRWLAGTAAPSRLPVNKPVCFQLLERDDDGIPGYTKPVRELVHGQVLAPQKTKDGVFRFHGTGLVGALEI